MICTVGLVWILVCTVRQEIFAASKFCVCRSSNKSMKIISYINFNENMAIDGIVYPCLLVEFVCNRTMYFA